jgi:uroporphyrinogen-III synthase
VLTREEGKNGKLLEALEARGIVAVEIPMVKTVAGRDQARLPAVLRSQAFAWVTLTSPEAASVFLRGWEAAGRPDVNLACVGAGAPPRQCRHILLHAREAGCRSQWHTGHCVVAV